MSLNAQIRCKALLMTAFLCGAFGKDGGRDNNLYVLVPLLRQELADYSFDRIDVYVTLGRKDPHLTLADLMTLPLLYTSRAPTGIKPVIDAIKAAVSEHSIIEVGFRKREEKLFHVVLFDSHVRKALYVLVAKTSIQGKPAVLIMSETGARTVFAEFGLVGAVNEWDKTK